MITWCHHIAIYVIRSSWLLNNMVLYDIVMLSDNILSDNMISSYNINKFNRNSENRNDAEIAISNSTVYLNSLWQGSMSTVIGAFQRFNDLLKRRCKVSKFPVWKLSACMSCMCVCTLFIFYVKTWLLVLSAAKYRHSGLGGGGWGG
jgi:hypothetical protein